MRSEYAASGFSSFPRDPAEEHMNSGDLKDYCHVVRMIGFLNVSEECPDP